MQTADQESLTTLAMPSTQDLSALPEIEQLKLLCQSLAMLDAIIEPDWEGRYYSFDSRWQPDAMMASMRDGSGDGYFILFNTQGAILKGFAHESAMSPYQTQPPRLWPGVLDEVPEAFAAFLTEPAFSLSDTTFCLWKTNHDTSWHHRNIKFPLGDDPDGSAGLLSILDGNPETYQQWAQEYYERPLDLEAIAHIYNHCALTKDVILQLNEELSLQDLEADAEEIAYRI